MAERSTITAEDTGLGPMTSRRNAVRSFGGGGSPVTEQAPQRWVAVPAGEVPVTVTAPGTTRRPQCAPGTRGPAADAYGNGVRRKPADALNRSDIRGGWRSSKGVVGEPNVRTPPIMSFANLGAISITP